MDADYIRTARGAKEAVARIAMLKASEAGLRGMNGSLTAHLAERTAEYHKAIEALNFERRRTAEAVDLLRGAQTHLLDGDNSIWRQRLDRFLAVADTEVK